MNIIESDLILRLQTLQCCIASLSDSLLTKIKIGSKDVNCKLEELQVLQRMFKYLKCYHSLETVNENTCVDEGLSVTFPVALILFGEDDSNISLNVQNILSVTMEFDTPFSPNIITLQQFADYVNTGILLPGFTGNRNIIVPGLVVSTTDDNLTLFLPYPVAAGLEGSLFSFNIVTPVYLDSVVGGFEIITECDNYTESDNCLTDIQVKTLLDYTANKCNQCFPITG